MAAVSHHFPDEPILRRKAANVLNIGPNARVIGASAVAIGAVGAGRETHCPENRDRCWRDRFIWRKPRDPMPGTNEPIPSPMGPMVRALAPLSGADEPMPAAMEPMPRPLASIAPAKSRPPIPTSTTPPALTQYSTLDARRSTLDAPIATGGFTRDVIHRMHGATGPGSGFRTEASNRNS